LTAEALAVSVDLRERRILRVQADAAHVRTHVLPGCTLYCIGRPLLIEGDSGRTPSGDELLRCLTAGGLPKLSGDFALVAVGSDGTVQAAIDRFGMQPLCWRLDGDMLHVSDRADAVPGAELSLTPQLLYDYLHFHMLPAPATAWRGVQRLPLGHRLDADVRGARASRWWQPVFDEQRDTPFAQLREEFLACLDGAVRRAAGADAEAAFLSGGTDSSTVAGLLGRVRGRPARTFSIGFAVAGYDEMDYARIAARAFSTDHAEYYVTADDVLAHLPAVAGTFDQPFGNSSALPAYLCARQAKERGIGVMLAGDGGDELFGGNERYARQKLFEPYEAVPSAVRRGLLEPLADATLVRSVPLLRKGASYVRQAATPLPDRLEDHNLLVRLGVERLFALELLAAIDREAPLRLRREVWSQAQCSSTINHLLHYDWRFTLADSDLPKVREATRLAGVEARYPLLDSALDDFALRLAPEMKLRGRKLRWFFKEALRGFLPEEILRKSKHGFGLPFGAWVVEHRPLADFIRATIDGLLARGWLQSPFVREILDRHLPEHPGYYGELIWLLTVLELRLQRAQA
jgi:asparagine synthase (glutamine-hydrolysing)